MPAVSGDSALSVRPEGPEDHAAVREIQRLAFGRPNEAELVDALRAVADPQISLVAEQDARVLGHVFFSPVCIRGGATRGAAIALGPIGVLPERQNQGVGSRLVRAGLDACLAIGQRVVFVLGHRRYYPRFGFAPAVSRGLRSEYSVPDEAFMVVELEPGALVGLSGVVSYLPEFSRAAPP